MIYGNGISLGGDICINGRRRMYVICFKFFLNKTLLMNKVIRVAFFVLIC